MDDENVIAGLLSEDKLTNDRVIYCLFHLYGEDCIRWLIRIAGRNQGETDIHNAHHAFEDALQAIPLTVKKIRFTIRDRSNSVRRYLYLVSQRCYWKLQRVNKFNFLDLSGLSDAAIYPKPSFVSPMETDERTKRIRDAVLDTPEGCRELLWMRFIECIKVSEIAKRLNTDPKKISDRLNKCRNKLQEIIPINFRENF